MNKRQALKLTRLAASIRRNEDAYQKHFSPRDFAIMSFRCGVQDKDLNTVVATARRFKLSESRVNQIQRKFENFALHLTNGSRVVAKGSIKDGQMVAEHETEGKVVLDLADENVKVLKNGFVVEVELTENNGELFLGKNAKILVHQKMHDTIMRQVIARLYKEVDKKGLYGTIDSMIRDLGAKARHAYIKAFVAMTVGVVLNVLTVAFIEDATRALLAFLLVLVIVSYGLWQFMTGLSLSGKRDGLILARQAQVL